MAGLGYSNPTPFHTPGEYSEAELAERLAAVRRPAAAGADLPRPALGHRPRPECATGLHAGSRAVREFIEKQQPEWFFCGHIHEAEGVEITLGRTRAMNVGKRGYLLELD